MDIRQQMRQKRRALSPSEQLARAVKLASHFIHHSIYIKANTIASFLSMEGEQDPQFINEAAQSAGKQVLLPIVNNFTNRLQFGSIHTVRRLNKFNIPEPAAFIKTPPWIFDVVLLPLCAFDEYGARIGMGGGFYDRTFAFTRYCAVRPLLIGIAHEFQRVSHIKTNSWDVPLNGILTEKQLTIF